MGGDDRQVAQVVDDALVPGGVDRRLELDRRDALDDPAVVGVVRVARDRAGREQRSHVAARRPGAGPSRSRRAGRRSRGRPTRRTARAARRSPSPRPGGRASRRAASRGRGRPRGRARSGRALRGRRRRPTTGRGRARARAGRRPRRSAAPSGARAPRRQSGRGWRRGARAGRACGARPARSGRGRRSCGGAFSSSRALGRRPDDPPLHRARLARQDQLAAERAQERLGDGRRAGPGAGRATAGRSGRSTGRAGSGARTACGRRRSRGRSAARSSASSPVARRQTTPSGCCQATARPAGSVGVQDAVPPRPRRVARPASGQSERVRAAWAEVGGDHGPRIVTFCPGT